MSIDLENFPLIAMIHLPQLKKSNFNIDAIIGYALSELEKIQSAGYSAVLFENFNDTPFNKIRVEDHIFSKLSIIAHEIKKNSKIPVGINILRNACVQAMTIASVTELDFIRCNIWEGAYITDQGIIESCAYDVIDEKTKLNSNVKILADIFVKHAIPIQPRDIVHVAKDVISRGSADAVIISGMGTGEPANIRTLQKLNKADIIPILGSGLNIDNLEEFFPFISGAIVGSSIKYDGDVHNQIDPQRAIMLSTMWKEFFDYV